MPYGPFNETCTVFNQTTWVRTLHLHRSVDVDVVVTLSLRVMRALSTDAAGVVDISSEVTPA